MFILQSDIFRLRMRKPLYLKMCPLVLTKVIKLILVTLRQVRTCSIAVCLSLPSHSWFPSYWVSLIFFVLDHVHYTERYHFHMCWVWVIFSTKSYCVIYFMSCNQFPHDNIFPSTGKRYRACQCEDTGASSWLCRRDSSWKCWWIFCGATWL